MLHKRFRRWRAGLFVLSLISTLLCAAATLKVSPESGPPNTRTSVSGSGFGASETVQILFDNRASATATTDSTGKFNQAITVPAAAVPGVYAVQAIGQSSRLRGQQRFTVRTDWPGFH